MINIKRFECNMLRENCYVVSDETKECVIIDCGAYYAAERTAVTDYINDVCEKILDTTAVFKNDEQGQQAFDKFIHSVIG